MIDLPNLRDYQTDFVAKLRQSMRVNNRVIACMPTGAGKSTVAKYIIGSSYNKGSGRAVIAVHRRGLVDNIVDTFNRAPRLPHGVIMSGRTPNWSERVQVASIDTLLSWYVDGDYKSETTFDLVSYDECVSGDSVLDTDVGPVPIADFPTSGASFVRSFDGTNAVMSRVTNWKYSGNKQTLAFHTHGGKIVCTDNHPIYTRRGWLLAKDVLITDELLVYVGAVSHQGQDSCCDGDMQIGSRHNNRKVYSKKSSILHRRVNVDAVKKLRVFTQRQVYGHKINTSHSIATFAMGTSIAKSTRKRNCLQVKGRRFLGHSWVIRQSDIRTNKPRHQGFHRHTVSYKKSGQNTRRNTLRALESRHELPLMMATGISQSVQHRGAFQQSKSCTTLRIQKAPAKQSLLNGLTNLVTSGLRGGFATTAQQAADACFFTPKDIRGKKTILLRRGFAKISAMRPSSTTTRKSYAISQFHRGHKLNSRRLSNRTSQSVCNTNWTPLISIDQGKAADVYDIEVQNTHCFFANNHLVHNCHSHNSKFAKWLEAHDAKRVELGLKPAFVIGLTATPMAKGLVSVYQEIVKGPTVQWLIDNGHLVPFRYFQARHLGRLDKLKPSGDKGFTDKSLQEAFDGLAGDMVKDWKEKADGRQTVGFFSRLSHAQEAMETFNAAGVAAEYIDGNTSDDKRKILFSGLQNGDYQYLCNVGIVDRGTDIPAIGCIQLCTAVNSIQRLIQILGRGARPNPGKQNCIVIDHGGSISRLNTFFEDDIEWVLEAEREKDLTHDPKPVISCPSCGVQYRGGTCSKCGYSPTDKERKAQGLEFTGGELVEITKREKKPKKQTCEQLLVSALYRAGKTGRTWKQAWGIANSEAKKQGMKFRVPREFTVGEKVFQSIPYGDPDGARRVSGLFDGVFA